MVKQECTSKMTTGHSLEAKEFLTEGAHALSPYDLTCAALNWTEHEGDRRLIGPAQEDAAEEREREAHSEGCAERQAAKLISLSLYIYIYVYVMFIYIYIYIYIYTHVYTYIHKHIILFVARFTSNTAGITTPPALNHLLFERAYKHHFLYGWMQR